MAEGVSAISNPDRDLRRRTSWQRVADGEESKNKPRLEKRLCRDHRKPSVSLPDILGRYLIECRLSLPVVVLLKSYTFPPPSQTPKAHLESPVGSNAR